MAYGSAISRREFIRLVYTHVFSRIGIFFSHSPHQPTIPPLQLIISIWHSNILVAVVKARLEQGRGMAPSKEKGGGRGSRESARTRARCIGHRVNV